MRFAETDKSIFLSTALIALQEKQHKIINADFTINKTLTVRESDVERTSTEIIIKSLENN